LELWELMGILPTVLTWTSQNQKRKNTEGHIEGTEIHRVIKTVLAFLCEPLRFRCESLCNLFLATLFLHVFVQTEADSIQFDQSDANRGHFYSAFGGQLGTFERLCDHPQNFHLT
jgi:hypothetical protein